MADQDPTQGCVARRVCDVEIEVEDQKSFERVQGTHLFPVLLVLSRDVLMNERDPVHGRRAGSAQFRRSSPLFRRRFYTGVREGVQEAIWAIVSDLADASGGRGRGRSR